MLHSIKQLPAWLWIGIICLLNLLTPWLSHYSGDFALQHSFLRCFAEEFWTGNLYPRWCTSANGGVGSPAFLFYFPLPALIYSLTGEPLRWLGSSPELLLSWQITLATFATALTCFVWLRGIAGTPAALIGVFFYLYAPYRMEVMGYRVALAELWALAWLPLMFHHTRLLACECTSRRACWLALAFTLALLSHVATTVAAGIILTLYLLLTTRALKIWLHYATAGVLALVTCSAYLSPAVIYEPFIAGNQLLKTLWSNGFISALIAQKHMPLLVGFIFTIIMVSFFAAHVSRAMRSTPEHPLFLEMTRFSLLFLLSFYALFPWSAPLWNLLTTISSVTYPWRMQAVIALILACAAALHFATQHRRRWMDWLILFTFLHLLANYTHMQRAKIVTPLFERMIDLKIMPPEYDTGWMEKLDTPRGRLANMQFITEYYQDAAERPFVTVTKGKGTAVKAQTGNELHLVAQTPLSLRLSHFYFPGWEATLEDGTSLFVEPDPRDGRIIIENIPKGDHTVMLQFNPYTHHASEITALQHTLLRLCPWLSLIGLTLMGWQLRRKKSTA